MAEAKRLLPQDEPEPVADPLREVQGSSSGDIAAPLTLFNLVEEDDGPDEQVVAAVAQHAERAPQQQEEAEPPSPTSGELLVPQQRHYISRSRSLSPSTTTSGRRAHLHAHSPGRSWAHGSSMAGHGGHAHHRGRSYSPPASPTRQHWWPPSQQQIGTGRSMVASARSAYASARTSARTSARPSGRTSARTSARASARLTPKPRLGPPTEAALCVLSGPGLEHAVVRHTNSFVIEARDAACNRVVEGGDAFVVAVHCNAQGIRARARVFDNGDGSYLVTYSPPSPGTFTIDVSLRGEALPGSPVTLEATTPTPVARQCEVEGHGLVRVAAREVAHFRIGFRDANGRVAHAEEVDVYVTRDLHYGSSGGVLEAFFSAGGNGDDGDDEGGAQTVEAAGDVLMPLPCVASRGASLGLALAPAAVPAAASHRGSAPGSGSEAGGRRVPGLQRGGGGGGGGSASSGFAGIDSARARRLAASTASHRNVLRRQNLPSLHLHPVPMLQTLVVGPKALKVGVHARACAPRCACSVHAHLLCACVRRHALKAVACCEVVGMHARSSCLLSRPRRRM